MLKSWWTNLQQRCQTCSRVTLGAGLVVLTFLIGAVMLTAGAAGLAWTNTEQFCTGCHEMKDNVYAEFKGTIHDVNRSGVRAICSNCHVPHEPWPLIKRKMRASFELWGHFVGVIDTKEKFQARRYELATRVWTRMKETDSLECRNCHHDNAFDPDKQSDRAKARHSTMKETGLTCIDCHFGIAHHEPDGPGPQELKVAKP
ncbi:MAG: NapC/NirT family cytochrome c [Betaproteobacteria bacterium]|nr:NapC/NirT family cytochrome c [Betaproteobacteria bacterium]